MKRLLLLCIFVFVSPLCAIIVNGYKYKVRDKIIYILSTDHEFQDSSLGKKQFEILQNGLAEWNKYNLINGMIMNMSDPLDDFYARLSDLPDNIKKLNTAPFDQESISQIIIVLKAMKLLDKHPTLIELFLTLFREENQKKQEDIMIIREENQEENKKVNLEGINKSIEENMLLINELRDLYEKFSLQDFNKELQKISSKNNNNEVFSFKSNAPQVTLFSVVADFTFCELLVEKYNKFYTEKVQTLLNNAINNLIFEGSHGHIFMLIPEFCAKELLQFLEKNYCNGAIFSPAVNKKINKIMPKWKEYKRRNNKSVDCKKIKSYLSIKNFLKKTEERALTEDELKSFFSIRPDLEINGRKEGVFDYLLAKYLQDDASPLEKKIVEGRATFWDKLKYKAWEWKNALIPVAAVGVGLATRWWLNKNAKLNPSKPYWASSIDMTDIGDKHWWLNLPKKN